MLSVAAEPPELPEPTLRITAGIHQRLPSHPKGALEAACIGLNHQGSPENPLGDRTELLPSKPTFPDYFTADAGDQETIRLSLPNPVLSIKFEEFRDERGRSN